MVPLLNRAVVAGFLVLLVALWPGLNAVAQESTPGAAPVPIDVGACTTEPLPPEELRALAIAGYAAVATDFAARQVAEGTPAAAATPVTENASATSVTPAGQDEPEPAATPLGGSPADGATVAGVTETITQYVACTNGGNLTAIPSLLTESGASRFLGYSLLTFVRASTGADTPSPDLDPVLLDAYLEATSFSVPRPREFQLNVYDIRDIFDLGDGRAGGIVVLGTGDEEPDELGFLLREVDGRFRIVFGDDSDEGSATTPAATPVA